VCITAALFPDRHGGIDRAALAADLGMTVDELAAACAADAARLGL
jgi:hypothetical protein